jgi:hypothetical protein
MQLLEADMPDLAMLSKVFALRECRKQLGLQGLACLASVSTELKHLCTISNPQQAAEALLGTLEAATPKAAAADADAPTRVPFRGYYAALHVMHTWPQIVTADVTSCIVQLKVTRRQAVQLVRAGIRMRYDQLLEAASSMVAGVEVWVQAQQQLGVQTDIPAVAVAICTGRSWVSAINCVKNCYSRTCCVEVWILCLMALRAGLAAVFGPAYMCLAVRTGSAVIQLAACAHC